MASPQDKYLPPEIWDQIFSEATYYPGEFDADEWVNGNELELARRDITSNTSTNGFILYNKMKGNTEANFQFQLDIRRSLVLVCKQWYSLAIRHLYGSIVIVNVVIRKLVHVFTSNEHLGPLVKRLELKDGIHENHASELESLLSKCPNIFAFYESSIKFGTSTMLWWQFLMKNPTSSAKLQYAAGVSIGVPEIQFLIYTSSLSSLVALKLPWLVITEPSVFTSIPISLPNLRVLDFGSINNFDDPKLLSYICTWDLPKLHTVWVPVERSSFIPLTEFWRKHGTKLATINLYNSKLSIVGIRLGEVSLGIESIGQPPSEIFPCLRQLIIVHNSKGYYAPLFLPSTSLEVYEVPFHGGAPIDELRRAHLLEKIVEYHLEQLPADKAPNLRIFKISGCPKKGDNERLREFYAEFIERHLDSVKAKLEARGVTLELVELE